MFEKVYFDLAAGLILLTIIISLQLRGVTKGYTNKMFIRLVSVCFGATLFDILRTIVDGNNGVPDWGKLLFSVIFFTLRNLSFVAYCFYIVSITDMWHKANSKLQLYIMPLPFFVSFVFSISSFFSTNPFFIDQNGYFVSGKGMWLFYLCNEIYGMYAVISIFVYKKYLGKRKTAALLSTVAASLIAYLINQMYPQYHMDMIFYSAGILFVMIVVQNPEVRLDYQSGLVRHAAFYDELSRSFESEKPMSIIMMDIKNFKEISHMLSYKKTSEFIGYLSTRIRLVDDRMKLHSEMYYIKDGKFRVEFVSKDDSVVMKAAEAFNNLFSAPVELEDMVLELSSIVCVVKCPENFDNIDAYQDFEGSLLEYDNDGKVVSATEVLANDEYNVVRHMDSIIEKALVENGLEVYYQPILDVETGKFDTAEALLRLYDSRYGYIYPEVFIAAAEKNGAIHRMGEFVLNEVCRFISTKEFDELHVDYISINVSVFQCLKRDFPDKVLSIINRYGVSYQKICLEITESPATDSQKVFFDNIEKLERQGITFALDDFGAGYFNVTTFANSLLNVIKFDKVFVKNMTDKRYSAILQNYVEMAKDFGKVTVIEGVETKEQAEQYVKYGCHKIQGFYYSNAVPEKEYVSFVKEHS